MEYKEAILKSLSSVMHPEYKKDVVSLELIDSYTETETRIIIQLLFRRKKDPMAATVRKMVEIAVKDIVKDAKKTEVIVIAKEETKEEPHNSLEKVKHIIAIASGKGGVGKSTVSVNLAVALAKKGFRTGLLDADIYGPSLPKMFGMEGFEPETKKIGNKDFIVPPEKYGVKMLSLGFFFDPTRALIWRGPMATGAIKNLLNDTLWGELDYLLIDLPPGTNDIHLTLVQSIGLSGAVVVTTPQMVAVADAVKGVNMFQNENIDVPVIGIVENMAWFVPDDHPGKKYYIFGQGGAEYISKKMKVPLLGQIPINENICSGGDKGTPAILIGSPAISYAIEALTDKFLSEFGRISETHKPHIVEIKKQ